MHILKNTSIDFLRWRWHAMAVSVLVLLAGLGVILTRGIPLGIEFQGGTAVIAQFDQAPSIEAVRAAFNQHFPGGGQNVMVQAYGNPEQRQVMVRVPQVGEESGAALGSTAKVAEEALRKGNLGNFTVVGTEIVGPSVGKELTQKGIYAFLASLVGILAYIAFRFQLSFAVGAVIATVHDIFVALAFLAFFQYDLTLNVIAAILTVTGYSTNDTIVIFDRVRENMRSSRRQPLAAVINTALNQTLGRTIITAGTTLLSSAALLAFGGEVLSGFAFTMVVGVITGTYSSLYVAAAVVMLWQGRKVPATDNPVEAAPARRGKATRKANA
ncbi:MAG: protein translocase subunit SecF [Vicinamibacterales bacterium]